VGRGGIRVARECAAESAEHCVSRDATAALPGATIREGNIRRPSAVNQRSCIRTKRVTTKLERKMVTRTPIFAFSLFALIGCTTRLPPAALAWNDSVSRVAPTSTGNPSDGAGDGYLRVETDTDLRMMGGETYYHLRRPYDVYADDGRLHQADIDNQGARSGEEPLLHPIAPGRYVVASMYGATYRKVQVEVRPGAVTEVRAALLKDATPVVEHDH
jgi:hypothetical protein